jgi:hypothetical protein
MYEPLYLHCRNCIAKRPSHISPLNWSRLDVRLNGDRIEVMCRRCKLLVGGFTLAQPPQVECELCKRGEEHTHG